MYAFLLVLGAVVTAAGLALVASGISVSDHVFDVASLTPGLVAVIGGCILIGLAFVVRALLRVERALRVRPMPRPTRPGEQPAGTPAIERSSELAKIPFPSRPKPGQHSVPAAAPLSDTAMTDRLREKLPGMERLENAPMVEESDVSLLPKSPGRSEEENGEFRFGDADGGTKTAPRVGLGAGARSTRRPPQAKSSIFDSLWPKAPKSAAESRPASETNAATPAPTPQSPLPVAEETSPAPAAPLAPAPATQQETAGSVSILKSGVVEGMAYTLYSDGSIEAQLPQGTLRFGSITELRNHIERNS